MVWIVLNFLKVGVTNIGQLRILSPFKLQTAPSVGNVSQLDLNLQLHYRPLHPEFRDLANDRHK
jgi:hypothetical protein